MSQFFTDQQRREILGLSENAPYSAFSPENPREEALKQIIFSQEFDIEALTLEAHPQFDWNQDDIVAARDLLMRVMEATKGASPDVCDAFLKCYTLLSAFSSALRDNDALRVVLQDFLIERGHNAQARAYEARASQVN